MNNANTIISSELDTDQLNALEAVNDHLVEVPAITPPAKLKAKRNRIKGIRALPFMADSPKKSTTPFWDLPAAGGYSGGCQVGRAMAESYIKFLRDKPSGESPNFLPSIANSMAIRMELAGGEAMSKITPSHNQSYEYVSLSGQMVGFFSTIDRWLAFAAKNAGGQLDGLSNKDFIKEANIGLTKEAWGI